MDKYRIIEWVINAVLVIVTTAVVTRLSLNQGKFGVTNKLKAKFTPKFKAYIKLIFSVLFLIMAAFNLYFLTTNPALPTRSDVLLIIIGYTGILMWLFFTTHNVRALLILREQEKAEKERELWQPLLDQMEEAKIVLSQSRELTSESINKPRGAPKDSIVGKPSDSQNPEE